MTVISSAYSRSAPESELSTRTWTRRKNGLGVGWIDCSHTKASPPCAQFSRSNPATSWLLARRSSSSRFSAVNTASSVVRASRALLVSAIAPRKAASKTTPMMTIATRTSSSVNPAAGSRVRDAANSVLVEIDRNHGLTIGQFDPPARLHPFARDRKAHGRRILAQQRLRLAVARDRQPRQGPIPGPLVQQVIASEQLALAAGLVDEAVAAQVALPGDRLLPDTRFVGRQGEQQPQTPRLLGQCLARVGRGPDRDDRGQHRDQHQHHQQLEQREAKGASKNSE